MQPAHVLVSLVPLTWLCSTSRRPWLGFQAEALAIFLVFVAAFVAYFAKRDGGHTSNTQSWNAVLVSAVVALVIYAHGRIQGIAPIDHILAGSLYVMAALLAGWLGLGIGRLSLQSDVSNQVFNGFNLWLCITALASCATVLIQWIQWSGLLRDSAFVQQWLLLPTDTGRPFGNIGQANLAATLGVFGVCAVLALGSRRALPVWVTLVLCAFLGTGIGLSQSRTGLLGILLITIYIFIQMKRCKVVWQPHHQNQNGFAKGVLLAAISAWVMALCAEQLSAWWWGASSGRNLTNWSGIEARLWIWTGLVRNLGDEPWFGRGIGTTGAMYLGVFPTLSQSPPVMFSYAHNVVLDLLIWFGVVPGLLICGFGTLALARLLNRCTSSQGLALNGMVLMFVAHAMLELPHATATVLVFASVAAGISWGIAYPSRVHQKLASGLSPVARTFSWVATGAVAFLITALSITLVRDYLLVERGFVAVQIEERFFTPPSEAELSPSLLVLRQWGDWLALVRVQHAEQCINVADLDSKTLRQVVLLHPSSRAMSRAALCLQMRGEYREAEYWLQRLCAVGPRPACEVLANAVRQAGQTRP